VPSKVDNLKLALWFIDRVGSIDTAIKLVQAAALSYHAMFGNQNESKETKVPESVSVGNVE
jgi:hypothetical protein